MARSNAAATQEHLPIAGIVDGVVLMTDGTLRSVLQIEPINFDLKSETEQNAIIYAYQAFLNSLDFPIQIVIQSKKLDLEQYLIRLEKSQKTITNDLLRIQIEDYVGFVRRLISVANIMSKRFYIVVSYAPIGKSAGIAQLMNIFHKQPTTALMDENEFSRFRSEVQNRANIIAGSIGRLGVKPTLLDTQDLIELYYGVYNPDVVSEERLTDIETLNAGVVSAPSVLEADEGKASAEGVATPTPAQTPAQPVITTLATPVGPQPTDIAPAPEIPIGREEGPPQPPKEEAAAQPLVAPVPEATLTPEKEAGPLAPVEPATLATAADQTTEPKATV